MISRILETITRKPKTLEGNQEKKYEKKEFAKQTNEERKQHPTISYPSLLQPKKENKTKSFFKPRNQNITNSTIAESKQQKRRTTI